MTQLALDLGTPVAPAQTVVSRSNEDAYALLSNWPRWPHAVVMVRGGTGTGKSHLARCFRDVAGAVHLEGSALTAETALALAAQPVVMDDADQADDKALFHLINAVRNRGGTMLLTASAGRFGGLADLTSRLRAVPEIPLHAPDDPLLRQVIIDRFQQRQLAVEPQVVSFLMTRMERTLHDAVRWVEALDKNGLAQKRAPTRPL
ncbi:MAG: hypothetical protein AAFW98_17245, partial [Pseudomonadota bacterium]